MVEYRMNTIRPVYDVILLTTQQISANEPTTEDIFQNLDLQYIVMNFLRVCPWEMQAFRAYPHGVAAWRHI